MDYVFYFDEIFHDRKIVIKLNGTINALTQNDLDNYIGVFWGCPQSQLNDVISHLQFFENKYKHLFSFSKDQELKSEIFTPKNFRFGVRSFPKIPFDFYNDLFDLLLKIEPIIHINAMSKVEFLLRRIFQNSNLHELNILDSFYYSLSKFFVTYRPKELISIMAGVTDTKSAEAFKNQLVFTLDSLVEKEIEIKRKPREREAYAQLSRVLGMIRFYNSFETKYRFIYTQCFEGLSKLLKERSISLKDVKVVIDQEADTFNAAESFAFKKVKQADSKNNIQVRLSDQLCGFVGKMIRALFSDPSMIEIQINNVANVAREDLLHKRILSPEWFMLNKQQFNLYKKVIKVLIHNNSHYWSAMTTSYFDEICFFYSFLRYIDSYKEYSDFIATSAQSHSEFCNTCCITAICNAYVRFDWE